MGTAEEHKALWRRFVEEVPNKRNIDFVDEAVAEDVVFYMPEPVRGREALKQTIKERLAEFLDVRVAIDHLIAEADQAAGLVSIRGTMKGEFMGQPVTGKHVTIQVAHFLRFSGGRIVEDRQMSDGLALLEQLGLLPIPEPA